jgi:hypothetical protein
VTAERVHVPLVIGEAREHVLICTFGANLGFYEGPLWLAVGRARNRVVLADDTMLARYLAGETRGTRLRHVNARYLVSPITNERAAHAKVILLADAGGATLLVGSGNLGMDGYASRGEVFCRYDIRVGDESQLGAFVAVKELLDVMGSRDYIDSQARRHVDAIWADAAWLWGSPPTNDRPVRHNLFTPLAAQLVDEIAGEEVVDLVVHAPFHDPKCEALGRLLAALRPAHATVLLQERQTSVDPSQLERVLAQAAATCEVALVEPRDSPGTYLHAKFILVQTPTRSVSLVGSPNLSLAALYRTDRANGPLPAGNIEVANLVVDSPEEHKRLLDGLSVTIVSSAVSTIAVEYRPVTTNDEDATRPLLLSGTWSSGTLALEAAAVLPVGSFELVIGGVVAAASISVRDRTARVVPGPDGARVLNDRVVPVWLRISVPDSVIDTTPVFAYRPDALAAMLTGRRDPALLKRVGALDPSADDPDLVAVANELEALLVIDAEDVWRIAKAPAKRADNALEGPHLRWEDIDFEVLRRHPRIAQYDRSLRSGIDDPPGDLEIVLRSILEQFRPSGARPSDGGEGMPRPPGDATGLMPDLDIAELPEPPIEGLLGDETPEEVETEESTAEEAIEIQSAAAARVRGAWTRLCTRYVDGLDDTEYLELLGPAAVTVHGVVFGHLFRLLLSKGILAPDRGVRLALKGWAFLWGNEAHDGYLDRLGGAAQAAATRSIRARGGEADLVGAMDVACQLIRDGSPELRTSMRLQWRHLLESPLLELPDLAIDAAFTGSWARLDELARESTAAEARTAVKEAVDWPTAQVWSEVAKVTRAGAAEKVEVLQIDTPGIRLEPETAVRALGAWGASDTQRDYYRVHQPSTKITAAWDRTTSECWWYDSLVRNEVRLEEPLYMEPKWSRASALLARARASK